MKRSRYSEPQIAFILRQADEAISVEPELSFFRGPTPELEDSVVFALNWRVLVGCKVAARAPTIIWPGSFVVRSYKLLTNKE